MTLLVSHVGHVPSGLEMAFKAMTLLLPNPIATKQ